MSMALALVEAQKLRIKDLERALVVEKAISLGLAEQVRKLQGTTK